MRLDTLAGMKKDSLAFLKALIETPSPCGRELAGQKVWKARVEAWADEIRSDAYGNVTAVLNPGGSPRIMLAAHADEIAMAVQYIDEDGYLYVRRLGGVDPAITRAQHVLIHTRKGPVRGVVGNVAPHLTGASRSERKVPEVSELFIDIGADSRKQAEKRVRIGDPITVDRGFAELEGSKKVVARAFDNRCGTWSVAEALRLLHADRKKLQAEVCCVSNVMEEIGCYGARQVAYSLQPDVALVVDVTHATDYPTVSRTAHGDIRLGKGPTLTHGTCNHPLVVDRLEEMAAQEKIPLQHEAVSSTSGTDTDVIFWTRGGIPSGLISIPNRYMHSPVEVIHLDDLEAVPRLMAAFALSLKKGENFHLSV